MSVRETYDVAVVGLGGMGSAVLARAAMRGARAIGVEQFGLGHDLGASSGRTRIIRKAYYENAAYVPLLLRAYDLWRDVERRTGTELMRITGLLLVGGGDSEVITGTQAAAHTYGLPLQTLRTAELRTRYPRLRVRDGEVGLFESDGGVVFPEAAIRAHLQLAVQHGAVTKDRTAVTFWEAGDVVRLHLYDGTSFEAASLVLTLGPWFAREMESLGIQLVVQRNVQLWFEAVSDEWDAARFPPFLVARPEQPLLYGFPDFGEGVKAAFHASGETTTPDLLRREVVDDDIAPVARALEAWMPGAAARMLAYKACMYSLTPDRNFVIGLHPRYRNVVVCGGFSGHGFKFASVVGEVGAQLALDGVTPHDIRFLSPARFA